MDNFQVSNVFFETLDINETGTVAMTTHRWQWSQKEEDITSKRGIFSKLHFFKMASFQNGIFGADFWFQSWMSALNAWLLSFNLPLNYLIQTRGSPSNHHAALSKAKSNFLRLIRFLTEELICGLRIFAGLEEKSFFFGNLYFKQKKESYKNTQRSLLWS